MRGVGLALDGRHAGGLGAGSAALGLALSSTRRLLPLGSPEGETLAEKVSPLSCEGRPAMDMWRERVVELSEAGGEFVGENMAESVGDA